ncbi:sensor histidine kinase [Dolosigranulum pigrum]|uniref:sensor histidine kinase n=1 Tax=Dolosigranulum pigrum TaxID=29394 RepID=UPI001AD89E3F|nr:sensor histidine kinase [Dolosigranulum pigrum]QTJ43747.1 sensor histidine kinase [Dolosigranulum pigrum]
MVAATREFIVELINMNAYDLYTFQFNVDHIDHPIYVRMERKMFDRMLHNLIYNAINHNPQGCHIRISIQPFDHFTRLSVRDNGIGTSTERLQEVRSRLNQPDILTARNSGIGLIVVNQIATIHGGKLDLASEPGQYFEAIITLESVNQ